MATTPFTFQADSGLTLSVKFEADGGTGTPAASYSATEKTTAKGWYDISITQALDGTFFWHAEDGSANIVANGISDLADNTDTHFGYDPVGSEGYQPDWNSLWTAQVAASVWDALATNYIDPLSFGLLFAEHTSAVDRIETDVETVNTYLVDNLGTNGVNASNIPWNASWDAEVQSEVADALTSYDTATETNVDVAKDQATIAAANTQK